MKIDIAATLGAVTREIASREHEGRPARVLVAARTYDTGIDDLWDALTNAERLPRWFLPISGDLRLGGRYQLKGNAGGEIRTCEPPRHLAVTWEYGGQASWVTVRLVEEAAGRTRLELEHVAHVDDKFWDQYGPGADPRCEHCMMHCGFEPSAAFGINSKVSDPFRLLSWMLR